MKSVLSQSEEKRLLNIYAQILLNFLCLSPAILDGHKLVFMVVRPAHISGEPNSQYNGAALTILYWGQAALLPGRDRLRIYYRHMKCSYECRPII